MISEVFGGEIRSSIKYTNEKQSNTSQPFFTLQLDIHVRRFLITIFIYKLFLLLTGK